MKKTERTVRVSIPYIQQAMASKEEFDALAFCLFVKLNFTSSEIFNASTRRLKSLTHMGSDRLKRIIDYCVVHNMIIKENGTLIFNKLCKDGKCLYKFRNKYNKREKKDNVQFNLTLTKVKDMLRRAILAYHIKKVENIREQALLTKNPNTTKEYRKGKSIVRELSVWGYDFFISNNRLAKVAKCSVSKARNIKREMVRQCEIIRRYSNTLVCDDASKFDISQFKKYCGVTCYLFKNNGKVYRHNPNVYDYRGKNVIVVPKNNK